MRYVFIFLTGFALAMCMFQPEYKSYKTLIESCERNIPVQCKIAAVPVYKETGKPARVLPYCENKKCLKK